MRPKNVALLSTVFLGFDASQVMEGLLRCPLRVERGEVNIVIWPDCVASCFGCGLVCSPAGNKWLLMLMLKGLVGFWRDSNLFWGGISVGKSAVRGEAWCLLFSGTSAVQLISCNCRSVTGCYFLPVNDCLRAYNWLVLTKSLSSSKYKNILLTGDDKPNPKLGYKEEVSLSCPLRLHLDKSTFPMSASLSFVISIPENSP